MTRKIILLPSEEEQISLLARRIKKGRTLRSLTQRQMSQRMGVGLTAYKEFEAGQTTGSVAMLVKALNVFGYLDRYSGLLENDPIGETLGDDRLPKRVHGGYDVADF